MGSSPCAYGAFLICAFLSAASCESQQKQYSSPPGYDFNHPSIFKMPNSLKEISGISFNKGIRDTIYAEEDENGKVFHFKLGDTQLQTTRFFGKGDFEDITICNDFIIMLRSDGLLFSFPLGETGNEKVQQLNRFDKLLPPGEFEGLASVDVTGKIYVLCKHCEDTKTKKWGGGYIFQMDKSGLLTAAGNFEINVRKIESLTGTRRIEFHPSALCWRQRSGEWYILSSVNKLLVVTDENWQVKSVYPLNPALFPQPEGIAFDREQNLYISNERNQNPTATILFFPLQLN